MMNDMKHVKLFDSYRTKEYFVGDMIYYGGNFFIIIENEIIDTYIGNGVHIFNLRTGEVEKYFGVDSSVKLEYISLKELNEFLKIMNDNLNKQSIYYELLKNTIDIFSEQVKKIELKKLTNKYNL